MAKKRIGKKPKQDKKAKSLSAEDVTTETIVPGRPSQCKENPGKEGCDEKRKGRKPWFACRICQAI